MGSKIGDEQLIEMYREFSCIYIYRREWRQSWQWERTVVQSDVISYTQISHLHKKKVYFGSVSEAHVLKLGSL